MCKTYSVILLVLLSSCAYKHNIKVEPQNIEKPVIEFSRELFEKPAIITEDRCYLLNSPKTEVICMLPKEYDKETNNYRRMLDIIKQYQTSEKYYNSVK